MNPHPPLDGIFPITDEMRASFLELGCLRLRGLCSAGEMSVFAEVVEDAFWRAHGIPMRHDGSDRPTIRARNLWRHNPSLAQFTLSKRFGRIAAELLGTDRSRLWSEEAQFTEPGGLESAWHQVQVAEASPFPLVQLWMPLHLITADMMGPRLAWKSHLAGEREVPPNPDHDFALQIAGERLSTQQIQEMAPGDAIFIHGLTLQAMPRNYSRWTREVISMTWVDGAATLDEQQHPIVFSH